MGFRSDAYERQLAHEEQNSVRAAYNRAQYGTQNHDGTLGRPFG